MGTSRSYSPSTPIFPAFSTCQTPPTFHNKSDPSCHSSSSPTSSTSCSLCTGSWQFWESWSSRDRYRTDWQYSVWWEAARSHSFYSSHSHSWSLQVAWLQVSWSFSPFCSANGDHTLWEYPHYLPPNSPNPSWAFDSHAALNFCIYPRWPCLYDSSPALSWKLRGPKSLFMCFYSVY